MTSWIAMHPGWYVSERSQLARHYPRFCVDESALRNGRLILYGEIQARPPGGTVAFPVEIRYPESTPYEKPIVTPLVSLPEFDENGSPKSTPKPKHFDHRHQMFTGELCLFQRETRAFPGGDIVGVLDVLSRAEKWFLGLKTGHWPPDCAQSELEQHFLPVGDVLMGAAFFDSDLSGSGRFYLVQDFSRTTDESGRLTPMIATALTQDGGVIQPIDARDDLVRVYPWIDMQFWDPAKIEEFDTDEANDGRFFRGYWWSLREEPKPFRKGEGLVEALRLAHADHDAWAVVSDAVGACITTEQRLFFGLRYPSRSGGVEWLCVCAVGKASVTPSGAVIIQEDRAKRAAFEERDVFGLRVNSVRPEILSRRNVSVVEPSALSGKIVALIGLGALGSHIAELLAKAGVGRFVLCDGDRLETGNVARHVGGLRNFGARKTHVVMKRLWEINPYLDFAESDEWFGSVSSSPVRLSQVVATADLTVCTTADESIEALVNQVAIVRRRPVLYGRALRRAQMGRVFLVRPTLDACKACLAKLAESDQGHELPADWIKISEDPNDIILHECGRPLIPGSAIDLSFISGLIARVALDYLESAKLEGNHWIWSRTDAREIDDRFSRPLSTLIGTITPLSECAVCQEPDVRRVVLSDKVREEITSLTEASPDSETGGILLGYIDDNRQAVVLRVTGPGPQASRSASHFEKDVQFIQSQVDTAASELGDRGSYIGEWHSHLEASPQPSAIDVRSLVGIVHAPNYLTRCPVMLIAGLAPDDGRVHNIRSWVFPVGGRMYAVPNEATSGKKHSKRKSSSAT